jgi:hypothetical protein
MKGRGVVAGGKAAHADQKEKKVKVVELKRDEKQEVDSVGCSSRRYQLMLEQNMRVSEY